MSEQIGQRGKMFYEIQMPEFCTTRDIAAHKIRPRVKELLSQLHGHPVEDFHQLRPPTDLLCAFFCPGPGLYDAILVGMGTLVPIYTLSRTAGYIHDVVVDTNYQGHGIGTEIISRLLQWAKDERGMEYVDLTSRSDRLVANRLYQSIGFQLRETNCYRYIL
jgi:ribosomal protein S18 acetylase RimI-like enzyme